MIGNRSAPRLENRLWTGHCGPDQNQLLRSTFTNVHTLNLDKTGAITLKMGCIVPQQIIFYVEIKENGIQNNFSQNSQNDKKMTNFLGIFDDIWICNAGSWMSWYYL